MKINRISLMNFGIYQGSVDYNLKVTNDKNIVLINGKNGSGKTTLLNAFKIALYGPLFLGYKTQHQEYSKYITSRINAFALERGDRYSSITIEFSLVEEGNTIEYILDRTWSLTADNLLNETLTVHRNKTCLSHKEAQVFTQNIAEIISPDYIDLFFFDGEKVDHLLAKSKSQEYIIELFNKLFNLDLFGSLKIDLKSYISQKNIFDQLSLHEKQYEEKLTTLQILNSNYSDLTAEQEAINREIKDLFNELKAKEQSFKQLGGLNTHQKRLVQDNIDDLIEQRESIRAKLKQIINEELPFLLLENELASLANTLKSERDLNENSIFKQKLTNERFLLKLTDQNIDVAELLKISETVYKTPSRLELIHDLSYSEESQVLNLIKDIESQSKGYVSQAYDEISILNAKIQTLNEQLHENLTDIIDQYTEELAELRTKISLNEQKLSQLVDEISNINERRNVLQLELDQLFNEIKATKKDENTYTLVNKINYIIDEYVAETRKIRLKRLEDTVTTIFKSLIRKDDFISQIKIDFTSERFIIFNKLGGEIPEENLSAGERQIYILSILWGLLKISERKIPIVFDTLLGRLDKTHKENIIKHFLHELGEQVIILATDTEIDEDYNDLLTPYLSKHYEIDYVSLDERVELREYTA